MQRRVHRTGCFPCSAFGFVSALFRLSAFGFRLSEDLETVITSELKPKRIKYGTVVPVRIDGGNSLGRRRSYFLRIVMRHNNNKKPAEKEVNIVYSPGQVGDLHRL